MMSNPRSTLQSPHEVLKRPMSFEKPGVPLHIDKVHVEEGVSEALYEASITLDLSYALYEVIKGTEASGKGREIILLLADVWMERNKRRGVFRSFRCAQYSCDTLLVGKVEGN
jgi:hypothetical protein